MNNQKTVKPFQSEVQEFFSLGVLQLGMTTEI